MSINPHIQEPKAQEIWENYAIIPQSDFYKTMIKNVKVETNATWYNVIKLYNRFLTRKKYKWEDSKVTFLICREKRAIHPEFSIKDDYQESGGIKTF